MIGEAAARGQGRWRVVQGVVFLVFWGLNGRVGMFMLVSEKGAVVMWGFVLGRLDVGTRP